MRTAYPKLPWPFSQGWSVGGLTRRALLCQDTVQDGARTGRAPYNILLLTRSSCTPLLTHSRHPERREGMEGPTSLLSRRADEILFYSTEARNRLSEVVNLWTPQVRAQAVEIILSSAFFGIYTILAGLAGCLLARKGLRNRTNAVMLTAILAIYLSSSVYWTTIIYELFWQLANLARSAKLGALSQNWLQATTEEALSPSREVSVEYPSMDYSLLASQLDIGLDRPLQQCVGTITLTVNVVLGDIIVWWRAWAVWRDSRCVTILYALLITSTSVAGTVVTVHGCQNSFGHSGEIMYIDPTGNDTSTNAGSIYVGDSWGLAASSLSLATNVTATSLIALKMWRHRRSVRDHLRNGSMGLRVESVLALLAESGLTYCILWVVVVVYQCASDEGHGGIPYFTYGFHYVIEACLISFIGIYPTVVILLVALGKSYCDAHFTFHIQPGRGCDEERVVSHEDVRDVLDIPNRQSSLDV
ncbi:hypothetical protein C8Q76DRAFT_162504 [Earliella scabrosa]|nr:hypothetical protein C8Q76DRAFT_162504 [Earliella scabrosa]